MEGTRGNLQTTRKQLEHVLGLRNDAGSDGVGNGDVVDEKKERMWPHCPLSVYL